MCQPCQRCFSYTNQADTFREQVGRNERTRRHPVGLVSCESKGKLDVSTLGVKDVREWSHDASKYRYTHVMLTK